ncbi:MAG: hypothetical protein NUV76_12415 [Candidatus Kuenenia sp.]|nr:hypothetical protein [Candidatus Kuenenia sp.]
MRNEQKGKKCNVKGCDNWCRSKELCPKHGMALRRYGNVLGGKVDREGICRKCGLVFKLKKSGQEYCDNKCYRKSPQGKAAAYRATKEYRARNKEKLVVLSMFDERE